MQEAQEAPPPAGREAEPPPRHPGRFRPEIHWWTPILLIAIAAVVVAVITLIVRRLARAAEDARWPDAEKRRRRDPE
jgi:uncharacterized protein HemY